MRFALLENKDIAVVESEGRLYNVSAMKRAGKGDGAEMPPQLWAEKLVAKASAMIESVREGGTLEAFAVPGDAPLLAPIPRPNRILAIGRNYADHARELGNAVPDEPIVFMKASSCVIGPGAVIAIPTWVGRVDYEAELLIVIGKGGKNIAEADAMQHVSGYTAFNDVTAREVQKAAQEKKQPWFLAKSLDTSGPLGPYFVTKDEIPDPHNLQITLSVNGEIKQNGSTAQMIHSVPALIAFLSKWLLLEEGDVIATGTPSGVGPMIPGDVIEIMIEKIGTLRNPVIAG